MKFSIDDKLRGKVFVGVGIVRNVENREYPSELLVIINDVVKEVRSKYSLDKLKDDPIIRYYRDFYWHELGIDPTKQRPAQEALLRRILRGEDLPRINPVVDIGNVASIRYLVPIGLYDIDSFGGKDLIIRYARDGEIFNPIGSPQKTLSSNQIILSTIDGLILHVYPYRDSETTKIRPETKNVLIVTAGVPGVDDERLIESAQFIIDLATKYLGGGVPIRSLS
ncbi:phenylalanine--tRNA ligase beta subunit-related protein [Vulcanisaeta distributa]|uniref:B3/B4 domain-containing protein n=1 Tax=Vulcanisaeta distributa TaxID=164451 RepID=UPI0006D2C26E|nr:phenylalanine--tRNA ligase beta subunit-related protein [Vulcanisaeta distributa]